MMKLILIALMLFPVVAFGVTISSLSGLLDNGEQVTVGGSGFGSKSQAAPFLWDPVEGSYPGLSNQDLVPVGCATCPWDQRWGSWAIYYHDTTLQRVPGKAVYKVYRKGGFAAKEVTTVDGTFYANWWIMSTKNIRSQPPEKIAATKLIRIWTDGGQGTHRSSWEPNLVMYYRYLNGSIVEGPHSTFPYFMTDFQWHHIEATMNMEAMTGTGGGQLTFDVDNVRILSSSSNLSSNRGPYDRIQVIGCDPSFPSRLSSDTRFFWGDIYIDNTLSRVVIGDAATYADCSHTEIQIPTSWGSSNITFTVNTGTFTDIDAAWLYVFDSNGNVNVDGRPVVIGQSYTCADGSDPPCDDGGGPLTPPDNLTATGGYGDP